MPKPRVEFYPLLTFSEANVLQTSFHQKVSDNSIPWALMGLEHAKVITLGKRADPISNILVDAATLSEAGYDVVLADRGGEATIHHPGQLVIYPILPLRTYSLGIKAYVDLLLETTKEVLVRLDIITMASMDRPGLYTEKGKIAFIGIRVDQGVSRHGISINVNNELKDFSFISSCGVKDAILDKVSNYCDLTTKVVFDMWHEVFSLKLASKSKT